MKKHQVIETWIKHRIDEGVLVPGEKLASESQLCAQFGVSRNAVRQAIHNLIHEGLVETTKGVGTFCRTRLPASPLSANIGLVEFFISSYIYPEIIRGCYNTLSRKGFALLLNQSEYNLEQERAILQDLRKKKVGGIIIAPIYGAGDRSNALLLEEIQNEGTAVVLCDDYFPGRNFSSVTLDYHTCGEEAAAHLWKKGHRKIGIFYQKDFLVKANRMKGVLDFLGRQEAPVRAAWMVGFNGQGPTSEASAAAERFLRGAKELPSAFVCGNDEDAMNLIQVAERQGIRVPGDLSVVGFDNSDIAQLEKISLTSVDHPSFQIGEKAADILLDKIFHPEMRFVTHTIITPSLVERSSVRSLVPAAPIPPSTLLQRGLE
ncbi:MAG: substrate-binding domain-containing protein [Spirochaetia bacterium]|jgi:GntR family transcriptional regulator of arabinose operon